MTHVRAAARLTLTALAYTIRIWAENRHRKTTLAYIDRTRALGPGARTTRTYREQELDE